MRNVYIAHCLCMGHRRSKHWKYTTQFIHNNFRPPTSIRIYNRERYFTSLNLRNQNIGNNSLHFRCSCRKHGVYGDYFVLKSIIYKNIYPNRRYFHQNYKFSTLKHCWGRPKLVLKVSSLSGESPKKFISSHDY